MSRNRYTSSQVGLVLAGCGVLAAVGAVVAHPNIPSGWIVLWRAIPYLILGALVLVGVVAYQRAQWHQPNEKGQMPIHKTDLRREALVANAEVRRILHTEATHAPVPMHLSLHGGSQLPQPAQVETSLLETQCPTARELLAQGVLGADRPFVFGWTPEGLVTGEWEDVYCAGIGGMMGSGKSVTATFLVLQLVMRMDEPGSGIYLVDPHKGKKDSLSTRLAGLKDVFLAAPAGMRPGNDMSDMANLVEKVWAELNRRIEQPDRPQPMVVLFIDEWTKLMRDEKSKATLPGWVASITTEGRGYNIFVVLMGQHWTVASSGGSEVRNTLTAAWGHTHRPEEIRMLTGLQGDEAPKDTRTLQPGECYFLPAGGELRKVRIPLVTSADVERVGRQVAQERAIPTSFPIHSGSRNVSLRAVPAPGKGVPGLPGNDPGTGGNAEVIPVPVDGMTRSTVLTLMREHRDSLAVARQLCVMNGKQATGRNLQTARALVDAVLAEALPPGAENQEGA